MLSVTGFFEAEFFPRAFLVDAHQEFLGEDDVAGVAGDTKVVDVHPDGVNGAGFGAESAEAAAKDVDVKPFGELLDMRIGRLAWRDVDAVARTDSLAEHTGGATHSAVLLECQAVTAPPAVGNGPFNFGILVGRRSDFSFSKLFETEHLGDMERHVLPEVGVGDPEPPDDFDPVDLLRDGHFNGDGGDFFVHVYVKVLCSGFA